MQKTWNFFSFTFYFIQKHCCENNFPSKHFFSWKISLKWWHFRNGKDFRVGKIRELKKFDMKMEQKEEKKREKKKSEKKANSMKTEGDGIISFFLSRNFKNVLLLISKHRFHRRWITEQTENNHISTEIYRSPALSRKLTVFRGFSLMTFPLLRFAVKSIVLFFNATGNATAAMI